MLFIRCSCNGTISLMSLLISISLSLLFPLPLSSLLPLRSPSPSPSPLPSPSPSPSPPCLVAINSFNNLINYSTSLFVSMEIFTAVFAVEKAISHRFL
ncbi:hypothetical protein C1646_309645 [Rhizophagus diaphanus]|nr:hypothetical protein C1646_309645 [Rhizophagus diaphanus] [Rhizophagus sp. MUCL 43196]